MSNDGNCLESLEPSALREALTGANTRDVDCRSDSQLSLSSNRIRGFVEDEPFVAISGAEPPDDRVRAFGDAVFWGQEKEGRPRFYVGVNDKEEGVLQAIATLNACLSEQSKVMVFANGVPFTQDIPDFSSSKLEWAEKLGARDAAFEHKPPLVVELESWITSPLFRWHMTVHDLNWSGRIGGLRVCRIPKDGSEGVLTVGGVDSKSKAAAAFEEIAGEAKFNFGMGEVQQAAKFIDQMAEKRPELGDFEHYLEDMILQNRLPLQSPTGRGTLTSLSNVSQVPALWSTGGKARYTDLLLKEEDGRVPWVIELKAGTPGQYYRHAITQAALYREFIRGAKLLHDWYGKHNVDATKCEAAVAFPTIEGNDAPRRRKEIFRLGELFRVEVIEFELPPASDPAAGDL